LTASRFERRLLWAALSSLGGWALLSATEAHAQHSVDAQPATTAVRPHTGRERGVQAQKKSAPELPFAEPCPEAGDCVGPEPGAFLHDGFYFRFSTGIGGYIETITPVGYAVAARGSGIGGTIELGAGTTVADGWALGIAAYLQRPLASDVELSDNRSEPLPTPLVPSFRDSMLLGPFVDWYPNPREGIHFQGAVGYVLLSRSLYTPGDFSSRSYQASGVGVLFGLGQEWWTNAQNSIGVTTQFSLSTAWGEVRNEGRWQHWVLGTPTFVFTWTHQ
jgi:hypothetical protein